MIAGCEHGEVIAATTGGTTNDENQFESVDSNVPKHAKGSRELRARYSSRLMIDRLKCGFVRQQQRPGGASQGVQKAKRRPSPFGRPPSKWPSLRGRPFFGGLLWSHCKL